jgi:hypothetical protein
VNFAVREHVAECTVCRGAGFMLVGACVLTRCLPCKGRGFFYISEMGVSSKMACEHGPKGGEKKIKALLLGVLALGCSYEPTGSHYQWRGPAPIQSTLDAGAYDALLQVMPDVLAAAPDARAPDALAAAPDAGVPDALAGARDLGADVMLTEAGQPTYPMCPDGSYTMGDNCGGTKVRVAGQYWSCMTVYVWGIDGGWFPAVTSSCLRLVPTDQANPNRLYVTSCDLCVSP